MRKNILIIGAICSVIVFVIVGVLLVNMKGNKSDNKTNKANGTNEISNTDKQSDKKDDAQYLKGKHYAKIDVENYGTISLELDADIAPITVTNFVSLAKSGFYDGLTFHRIMKGFMIQGGDPNGDGTGGSDKTIKGEFSVNGVENNISHVRGVISMARSNAYNSASSQFFIVHEDSKFLDTKYAGFGYVTEGMEIVDKICEDIKVEDDNGTVLKENQPKIKTIKIVE